ncbi:class I SAM-dependent methyltransferase [Manganibacter manganicus]|uniref:Methyltransferase n=1 Tax=Manganibacter manganicus TaxID=1873176 RepID=A0A1V8RRT0_9HYPH|nr:class I SAM-dependent methyltransferase [Pseudaminobacter manganicus]OQM75689.1 methyltransferase [Pseudaminobacter manganicus]
MTTTGGLFPATSMPDRDWWSALWPDPEGTLRQLGIAPDMSVLDLCCGDGYFTAALARLVGGQVYALDLDPVMIERAKDEVSRQGASVRKWIVADALDAAHHLSATLDCVLMANTFHGVPDQTRLAAVIHKVLRPSGLLVIVNWRPLPREQTTVLGQPRGPQTKLRMSPQAVSTVVEPAGFVTVQVVDLPPYHYGSVLIRAGQASGNLTSTG